VASPEVVAFLKEHPEYIKTLEKGVEHEERNANNKNYLGWEWYDVETLGAKLMRLVTSGIIKVNFKSRSTTCYLMKDKETVKKALKSMRGTG